MVGIAGSERSGKLALQTRVVGSARDAVFAVGCAVGPNHLRCAGSFDSLDKFRVPATVAGTEFLDVKYIEAAASVTACGFHAARLVARP